MDCPRCNTQLRRRRVKSVGFMRCPACEGSWYAADRLRILKDREAAGDYRWIDVDLWRDRPRFRAGKQERLACPKDERTLVSVRYGDSRIRVDICDTCRGIWLDAGEYAKVLRYLQKTVDTQTLRQYLDGLREEFVEIFLGPENAVSELADFAKVLHLLELRFVVQHPGIAGALATAARGVPGG